MQTNHWLRHGFTYLLILVTLAALAFNIFQQPRAPRYSMTINQVLADAKEGLIERIETSGTGGDLLVTYRDEPDTKVHAQMERGQSITQLLLAAGVPLDSLDVVVTQSPPQWDNIIALLGTILPFLLIGGLFYFLLRRAQPGSQAAQNLVKHNWQIDPKPAVKFADVGGMHEAKQSVADLVAYLKDPGRSGEVGARMPRAALVQGPPGVGKSLFVQAVAGEAGAKFIHANSAEFIELFCGVGAARVRNLFEEAKKQAPAVILLDELDAVGHIRTALGKQAEYSEHQLLLSQLFKELDQMKAKRGVVFFAATNRPDLVDPALVRAGRLERQITIGLPDEAARLEILNILARDQPLAPDVDLAEIARQTEGRTGADLASIVNQAAVLALEGNGPRPNRSSAPAIWTKP